jgi:hypothetical protein
MDTNGHGMEKCEFIHDLFLDWLLRPGKDRPGDRTLTTTLICWTDLVFDNKNTGMFSILKSIIRMEITTALTPAPLPLT